MSTDNTKRLIANGGPVTSAIKAVRESTESPWSSDGTDRQERRVAAFEARRALEEGFNDRAELLELSIAAYRGPVELARRIRETDFGGGNFPKRRSLTAYLRHFFGEDHGPHGEYASAYTYELQAVLPFVRSIH